MNVRTCHSEASIEPDVGARLAVRFAPYLLLAILAGIPRLISLDLVSWTGDEEFTPPLPSSRGDWPMVGLVSVASAIGGVHPPAIDDLHDAGLRDSLSGAAFIAVAMSSRAAVSNSFGSMWNPVGVVDRTLVRVRSVANHVRAEHVAPQV